MGNVLDIFKRKPSAGIHTITPSGQLEATSNGVDLSGLDFGGDPNEFELKVDDFIPKKANEKYSLETNARLTLIRFLNTTPMGEEFIFRVPSGRGPYHLGTMRVVISSLKRENRGRLQEFKLLHRETITENGMDIVKIMRVPLGSGLHKPSRAYDELLKLLTLEGAEK